ncbi:hypothetical protein PI125_g20766 [Phytophthora idaei]|nr:hypothetical protein PI125_g20766 [Phytophthora idaei]
MAMAAGEGRDSIDHNGAGDVLGKLNTVVNVGGARLGCAGQGRYANDGGGPDNAV